MISSENGLEYTGRPCRIVVLSVLFSLAGSASVVLLPTPHHCSDDYWFDSPFLWSLDSSFDLLASNSTLAIGESCDITLQQWEVTDCCLPRSHYWNCSDCWHDQPY